MKKFGIFTNIKGEEILFMAVDGAFASSAWIESNEAFDNTLGTTFLAITADDGEKYNIGRTSIRRVTKEEFDRLFIVSSPAFKTRVLIDNMSVKCSSPSKYIDYLTLLDNIPYLIGEGYTPEEIVEYVQTTFC